MMKVSEGCFFVSRLCFVCLGEMFLVVCVLICFCINGVSI